MESDEAVGFVVERMDAKKKSGEDAKEESGDVRLSSICEELCDACMSHSLEGDGTGLDNETAMIVVL